jgi:PAS domain S-box-containing protein
LIQNQEWPGAWQWSLRLRQPSLRLLIIALIVELVLPFVGAALFVTTRLSDAERAKDESQHLGIARAFSSEIDRQLLNAEAALKALATSPELRDGDLETFYRQSAAVADQHGARVVLADAAAGRQIFNTARPFGASLARLNEAELARSAISTQKTQISDLFRGTTTEDYLVGVFVPVIASGSQQRVLIMAFRPERLSSFFAEQHVPDEWTIAIVDRTGTFIGRNRALERFLGKPATSDLKAAMDSMSEGLATLHTADGIEMYTAFARSALSGWTVAFGIPRSVVDAPLRQSLVEIGMAGGLVIILCGAIALLTARRISRSMRALSTAALALGSGEQLPQLTPSIKEMDEVIAAMRNAADRLARRSAQRDRAEAALRESEQRFRDIAEVGSEWIWETDADHRFTFFAGATVGGVTPLGPSPKDILGKTRWELVGADPETDEQWRRCKAEFDAHRAFRRLQYSAITRSGRLHYFSVGGNPIFDENGEFKGYRGTSTDDTETVEALQRAELAEALLRDAVDSISEGFVIYDRDDRLVMFNDVYRRLFLQNIEGVPVGTTYEEVLRANVRSGQHALGPGEEAEWIAQKLKEHNEAGGAVEHRLSDGRWVLIADRRMRNGGIAGLRVDITALKAVQAELRASREHLARAQRVAATGSFELDLRTRRIEWSDETYRIFGVTRDLDPLDQGKLEEMVIPEDREHLRNQIAACVEGQQQTVMEYRIRRPDGRIRVLYRDVEVLRDNAGQPRKLIGVVKDVTELREAERRRDELERELIHSQKLEALGTLAGGVAHDLNNTLLPILALSKLALDELPEGSPVRGDIEVIIRASEHARDVVKQILAFSRKQDLVKREVDLVSVTREVLRMLRAGLPTMIQIVEQITPVPPLFGDAGELHQVIVNLVTNAAQAIGGGVGRIMVRIWSVSEPPNPAGAMPSSVIYLSVADTGCGIDPATVDRIFEPFFTTKQVGDGSGLGLSVVHGIVTGHGGAIVVHSQPGEGTEFVLSFPVLDRFAQKRQIEAAAA